MIKHYESLKVNVQSANCPAPKSHGNKLVCEDIAKCVLSLQVLLTTTTSDRSATATPMQCSYASTSADQTQ